MSYISFDKKQLVNLSWDATAPVQVKDIDSEYPAIVITQSDHKGKRTQEIPLNMHMIAVLREIPARERTGRVFEPMVLQGDRRRPTSSHNTIGDTIATIGEAAGIVTGTRMSHRRTGTVEVPAYATMHDLKATFIKRMEEARVPLSEIMFLAQHKDVKTTMRYIQGTTGIADRLKEAFARQSHKPISLKIRRA